MSGLILLDSTLYHYTPLPDGAKFDIPQRPKMVTALHRWFSAQLSDHGKYA
jgi:hypothetical protein